MSRAKEESLDSVFKRSLLYFLEYKRELKKKNIIEKIRQLEIDDIVEKTLESKEIDEFKNIRELKKQIIREIFLTFSDILLNETKTDDDKKRLGNELNAYIAVLDFSNKTSKINDEFFSLRNDLDRTLQEKIKPIKELVKKKDLAEKLSQRAIKTAKEIRTIIQQYDLFKNNNESWRKERKSERRKYGRDFCIRKAEGLLSEEDLKKEEEFLSRPQRWQEIKIKEKGSEEFRKPETESRIENKEILEYQETMVIADDPSGLIGTSEIQEFYSSGGYKNSAAAAASLGAVGGVGDLSDSIPILPDLLPDLEGLVDQLPLDHELNLLMEEFENRRSSLLPNKKPKRSGAQLEENPNPNPENPEMASKIPGTNRFLGGLKTP